jgi:hypothetical protein
MIGKGHLAVPVIPGQPTGLNPESRDGGAGFRVRVFDAPRNDDVKVRDRSDSLAKA